MNADNGGLRYNEGKLRLDLLPFDALEQVSGVLTDGANKYQERNWERGMNWSWVFASLLRHLFAWWQKKNFDKESGRWHMAHVVTNALFLLSYQLRDVGKDDRP